MTAVAKVETNHPVVVMLGTDLIDESPTNPRKSFSFKSAADLAADVKKRGILQPVLTRPHPTLSGRHELVFGARRFRAARLAGLEEIPAFVRVMTDAEVLETQIVENNQRDDITPLEEAEGYEQLHNAFGYSTELIASKINRPKSYVYGRMKLCALVPEARQSLADGKISVSVAGLVARLPPKLQLEALEEVEPYEGDDEPTTFREASNMIQRRFMLQLDEAPWSLTDKKLLPAAGSCAACPKRTGNQPELFADVKAKDTCTDPSCFAEKKEAHWVQIKTKAEAEGRKVLSEKETQKVAMHGFVSPATGFIDLNAHCYAAKNEDDDGTFKTYGEILGKAAPPSTLARSDGGKILELVPIADVTKLLAAKGVTVHGALGAPQPKPPAPSPIEAMKRVAAVAAARVALTRIVAAVEKKDPPAAFWLALVTIEIDRGAPLRDILVDRGFLVAGEKDGLAESEAEARFRDAIAKLNAPRLRGLYIELLLAESLEVDAIATALRIDMKKLEAAELVRLKKEAKAAPKPKAKAKSQPGTCRVCGCTDDDCEQCVQKTGAACTWSEPDLCSACATTKSEKKGARRG